MCLKDNITYIVFEKYVATRIRFNRTKESTFNS